MTSSIDCGERKPVNLVIHNRLNRFALYRHLKRTLTGYESRAKAQMSLATPLLVPGGEQLIYPGLQLSCISKIRSTTSQRFISSPSKSFRRKTFLSWKVET